MRAYRVLPWLRRARAGEPGHPLYVSPRQTAGRLDNPEHYRVLYLADRPAAALAEAFGAFEVWTTAMLLGPPALPGSVRCLAEYEVPDGLPILDLDDPAALVEWALAPSQVLTRERAVTQAWALRIYRSGRFAGVKWWSYYEPTWGGMGLWGLDTVTVVGINPLTVLSDELETARKTLMRSWVR